MRDTVAIIRRQVFRTVFVFFFLQLAKKQKKSYVVLHIYMWL